MANQAIKSDANSEEHPKLKSALDSRTVCWIASRAEGDKCLVVDCRNNVLASILGKENFLLTGVDADQEVASRFNRSLKEVSDQKAVTLTGDIKAIENLSIKFDTLIIGESIERIGNPKDVMRAAIAKLNIGGSFILAIPLHQHPNKGSINSINQILNALPPQLSFKNLSIKSACFCYCAERVSNESIGSSINSEQLIAALEEGLHDYQEMFFEHINEISDWSEHAAKHVESAASKNIVSNEDDTIPSKLQKSFERLRKKTIELQGSLKQKDSSIASLTAELINRHIVEKNLQHNLANLYGESLVRSPVVAFTKRNIKKLIGKHPYTEFQADAELSKVFSQKGAEAAKDWLDKAIAKNYADEAFLCAAAYELFKDTRHGWAKDYGKRAVQLNPALVHIQHDMNQRS